MQNKKKRRKFFGKNKFLIEFLERNLKLYIK